MNTNLRQTHVDCMPAAARNQPKAGKARLRQGYGMELWGFRPALGFSP
jgi:hypothetical protein